MSRRRAVSDTLLVHGGRCNGAPAASPCPSPLTLRRLTSSPCCFAAFGIYNVSVARLRKERRAETATEDGKNIARYQPPRIAAHSIPPHHACRFIIMCRATCWRRWWWWWWMPATPMRKAPSDGEFIHYVCAICNIWGRASKCG